MPGVFRFHGLAWLTVIFCAAGAWGQYGGGSGTVEDPYQISLPEHLDAMHYHPEDYDKHFILTNDIDMSGYVYQTAVIAYNTVGSNSFEGTPFSGSFNGGGYTISNLTIDTEEPNVSYLGLFGKIVLRSNYIYSRISSLNLDNINIRGGYLEYVGVLVGYNASATIDSCYAAGSVSGSTHIGGLVGANEGTILRSHTSTTIYGDLYFAGGLVGSNSGGTISDCYATGDVEGNISVGGLVGGTYECAK